jgi:hypothetical protein
MKRFNSAALYGAGYGLLCIVIAACAPEPTAPLPLPAYTPARLTQSNRTYKGFGGFTVGRDLASRSLARIAHTVALSLNDPQTRASIRDAIATSPFKEHKVSLQRLLTQAKPELLSAVALSHDGTMDNLRALLDSSVQLELYMPVHGHFDKWLGDDNLLVAYQLGQGDSIVAFTTTGRRSVLSASTAPEIPTLVLVESETNFDRIPRASTTVDCDTHPELCGDGGGGGGSGGGDTAPPDIYPYMYATSIHLDDLHEPWTRGDPEIEIHLTGSTIDHSHPTSYACAGEYQSGARYFNMDDHDWSGSVQIASFHDVESVPVAYRDSIMTFALWWS